MLPPDLKHFRKEEFRHPDIVDPEAAYFLDAVRDRFTSPLIITDDARTPEDHPAGGSPSSLHYAGRAFDLRWIQPAAQLARFVEAVVVVCGETGQDYELELVPFGTNRHVHLGLQKPLHPSELWVSPE